MIIFLRWKPDSGGWKEFGSARSRLDEGSQYGLRLPLPGVEFPPDTRFVLRLPTLGGRLVLQLQKIPFYPHPPPKPHA